jgi:hypothetical protein
VNLGSLEDKMFQIGYSAGTGRTSGPMAAAPTQSLTGGTKSTLPLVRRSHLANPSPAPMLSL